MENVGFRKKEKEGYRKMRSREQKGPNRQRRERGELNKYFTFIDIKVNNNCASPESFSKSYIQ